MSKHPPARAEMASATHGVEAIVIGGSAGVVDALLKLLPPLVGDFHLPIMVVVHVPPDGRSALANFFRARCRVRVIEAEDKMPIEPGTVYFAPADYHLLVEPERVLSLSIEAPVVFSRPSIDVLFESAADAYGPRLLGIILTGASRDGAQGLAAIVREGGRAWVQNPATAEVAILPRAALLACPHAEIVELADMVNQLREPLSKPQ